MVLRIQVILTCQMCGVLCGQMTENTRVFPPVIHLAEGVEARIYYDNVVQIPESYSLEIECPVGIIGEDAWSFTPASGDEGLYRFAMTLRDEKDGVVAAAETILAVIRQSARTQPLRLMAIGDSLTAPGHYQQTLALRMTNAGIAFETLGTVSNGGFNYEGYGGNTFQRYLEGPYYFRSPFVYSDTGFDPERYFIENTFGGVPTLYLIFLGINDTFSGSNGTDAQQETRLNEVMVWATTFIEGMRAAAPGSDVGIVLTPAGSADQAAYDAAYGERVYTVDKWQAMRLKLVARTIEAFGNREDEGIFLVPVSVGIDRFNDYSSTDPLHPDSSGYEKIGDMIFTWLNYYLQKHAYPRWALANFSRESILAGEADPDDNPDGDFYTNRLEHIFRMDPQAISLSPMQLSRDGLSIQHLESNAVILETTTNLYDWEEWKGIIEVESVDGYLQKRISLEFLTDRFFRVRQPVF